MDLRRIVPLLALSATLPACNPYKNRSGEFFGGSVDPAKFPAAYKGVGFAHNGSQGTFAANAAFYKDQQIGYYQFPFQTIMGSGGLLVGDPGVMPPAGGTILTTPDAFVFDPTPPTKPFPSPVKCQVPMGYAFNEQQEAYHQDDQGNIFTALPDGTGLDPNSMSGYLPIVAETVVTSMGEGCNSIKSAEGVVTDHKDIQVTTIPIPAGADANNVFPTGKQDERYLAWPIIDPSADVLNPDGSHDPNTGLGPQKWGWFDHLLLAYLDGGYIPTNPPNPSPGDVAKLVFQNIYVPDDGTGGASLLGMGMDVLAAKRGDATYSPLCMVNVFTPLTGVMVTNEDEIIGPNANQFVMGPPQPTNTVIACIQVQ